MFQELPYEQNVSLERAKMSGYLICPAKGNEMLLYIWIEWCRKQNRVCLYALLDGEQGEVVLNTTTTKNKRVKCSASALQRVCDQYINRKTGGKTHVHDTDGCRISGVRIDRVSQACRDILSTARQYWPQTS